MIRVGWWLPAVSAAIVLWYECAENPMVFCYRIGWGSFAMLRSLRLAPIPNSARTETACCNPSFIFSARSTVLTDFEN
jgi:hypothetical protein